MNILICKLYLKLDLNNYLLNKLVNHIMLVKRIVKVVKNPKRVLLFFIKKTAFFYPDVIYIKALFYLQMGKKLNLKNPQTYNEKLNWLKLYNRKPKYTEMVDKYAVKKYVSDLIGNEYIIPTLGVWENPKDIDWNSLPCQFVLKTTHGGGNTGVIICKNKNDIDVKTVIQKLKKSLKQDLYRTSREWPYKNIKKRIIAEPYMEDSKTQDLRDYKFLCFDGEVRALFIGSERQKRKEPYFDFFDESFNLLPIRQGHPNSELPPEKPICFEEMKNIASKLSKGIPHVRVDLYEANGKVYFGELTFFHFGGFVPFYPTKWDNIFGEYLNLPR